jgi:hypothetical protein
VPSATVAVMVTLPAWVKVTLPVDASIEAQQVLSLMV